MTDTRLVHHLGEIEALAMMAPIHERWLCLLCKSDTPRRHGMLDDGVTPCPDGRATIAPMPSTRPRGRPRTGETPAADRQAKSKAALLEAGGRRLTVNLDATATAALERVKQAHGFDTDRQAIEHALIRAAAIRRR